MKIYTRRGDDGTTSLRTGERVAKDDPLIELVGALDEAQSFLGLARAEEPDAALDALLVSVERDLWIVMADVVTAPEGRGRVEPGVTAITPEMVQRLELEIDRLDATVELAPAFAVPGDNRLSAALDVARAVVRRAERRSLRVLAEGSLVGAYLNRLSDLCWLAARATEGEHRTHHRARRARTDPPA